MNRVGFLNFWLYDEEEFSFADGKLLLRGANASGKSITTSSVITLVLDGDRRPERLDPFGSRDRHVKDYLLGEDASKEDVTAYIYLEFVRPATEQYLTIGIGQRARRSHPNIPFWGFCITDGRRIGPDIKLYREGRIPLLQKELEKLLGAGGVVVDSQEQYLELVNRKLFGFAQPADYKRLVDLMIKVRTPKLDKNDMRPETIKRILNDSLQLLSRDDLAPMITAIESMEAVESRIIQLRASRDQLNHIKREYDRYNRYILGRKGKEYLDAQQDMDKRAAARDDAHSALERMRITLVELEQSLESLQREREGLEARRDALSDPELALRAKRLGGLESQRVDLEKACARLRDEMDRQRDRQRADQAGARDAQTRLEDNELGIAARLEELEALQEELQFPGHPVRAEDRETGPEDCAAAKRWLNDYQTRIRAGQHALKEQRDAGDTYNQAVEELQEAQAACADSENQVEEQRDRVEKAKNRWVDEIHGWNVGNRELKLSAEELAEVTRSTELYCERGARGWETVLGRRQSEADLNIARDHSVRKLERDRAGQEHERLTEELRGWEEQPDPRPEHKEQTDRARRRLREADIPFVSFYQAVEFVDGLDPKTQGSLEEQLQDAGLLDALIVPLKHRGRAMEVVGEGGAERFLWIQPSVEHNLTAYLQPAKLDDEALERTVHSVLCGIGTGKEEQGAVRLYEDGRYVIGPMSGRVSREYDSRYVGALARRAYRAREMARLQRAIGDVEREIEGLDRALRELEDRRRALADERQAFPPPGELDGELRRHAELRAALEQLAGVWKRARKRADEAKELYDRRRVEAAKLTGELPFAHSLQAYEEALELCAEYRNALDDYSDALKLRSQGRRELQSALQSLERTQERIDQIDEDLRDRHREKNRLDGEIKAIRDYLESPESQQVFRELEELERRLREIASRSKRENEEKVRTATNIERGEVDQGDLEAKANAARVAFECARSYLEEEVALELLAPKEPVNRDLARRLRDAVSKEDLGRAHEDAAETLRNSFQAHYSALADYSPKLDHRFAHDERFLRRRLEITFRVDGKYQSLYGLADYIKNMLAETELVLRDKDKQLFEEILADTLMQNLRERISESRRWVGEMDDLMCELNTSMGMRFFLTWKGKPSTEEGELDARTLERLLGTDTAFMAEEDRARLTGHFRAKMERERNQARLDNRQLAYEDLVRDALDYRNWFEFNLSFQKRNETKKELTGPEFNRMSGGERAMAMYVPLFAAIYAQYRKAGAEAPRFLALDEAFAGVDEENIGSMFGLMEELGLGYLLNSQALWGCYPSVAQLSIAELIRPGNADFVTVLRYLWNGKVRDSE